MDYGGGVEIIIVGVPSFTGHRQVRGHRSQNLIQENQVKPASYGN